MIVGDIGNVLLNVYKFWKEDKETRAWIGLLLSVFFSAFIAFTGICGGALAAGHPFAMSIGLGLVATSVSVLGVLLRDPRARVLLLSVPQPVVKAYQDAANEGQSTITGDQVPKK